MVNEMLQQAPTVASVNAVLLQAWDQIFGTVVAPRAGFVSVWKHRALAMQAHSLLSRWHHLARYRSIRRVIQRRVQADKRAKIQQQLVDAEQASSTGQPGALYQVLRRIAPKIRRRKLQLRDTQGRLVGPREEATLILDHYSEVFASKLAVEEWKTPSWNVLFTLTPMSCIMPSPNSPNTKPCRNTVLLPPFGNTAHRPSANSQCNSFRVNLARGHFGINGRGTGHCLFCAFFRKQISDWRLDAIAKLRPISLLHPLGKSFAVLPMYRVRETITHKLASIPQFAYLVGRSTADAVDRAVWHVHRTRQRLGTQYTIHHRRAGIRQQSIQGSLTLSIDLRRAFDSIDRGLIRDALKWAEVPTEVLDVIVGLHEAMRVCFTSALGETRSVSTGRGLRQGCRLAPIVWSCITGFLPSKLIPIFDQSDLQPLLTLFADDTLSQWEINDQVLTWLGRDFCVLRHSDSSELSQIRQCISHASLMKCLGDVEEAVAKSLKEGPAKATETTPQAAQQLTHLSHAGTAATEQHHSTQGGLSRPEDVTLSVHPVPEQGPIREHLLGIRVAKKLGVYQLRRR
ncbi:unnamed protein product [Symbiodinium sp. CCMP2592]|nr:unnamed protein product [Symbiodinium sp. CCMP2592]